ncbi:MAG: T9SS type A sorting domain-containing protein [Bacteroidetes bacterium]|nr:T9SS type A sorting domain-containing protein [Bacteroidota bacterium]
MKLLQKSLPLICCLFSVFSYSQSTGNISSPTTEPSWNWSKKYAGNGGPVSKDINSESNGNFYMTGHFNGSLTFNNITINSSGSSDLFIVKTNSSGDAIWVKKIPASDGKSIFPCRLVILSNGDFLVNGIFNGTASFPANLLIYSGHNDAFVARFDASGNNLWAAKYSDTESLIVTGLSADAGGNSYMTANLQTTGEARIIKFNSSGQLAYSQSYSNAYFADIACNNSNLYLCGYISSSATFGTTTLSSGNYPSSLFGQTDLSGNFTWADNGKSASGISEASSIAVDNSGNIYSSGYFADSIRFRPASVRLTDPSGFTPLFIVKYNSSGTALWASQFADRNVWDYPVQLSLDGTGNPFVFSYYDMGFTFGSSNLTKYGNFVASYSSAGAKQWAGDLQNSPTRTQVLANGEMIQSNDYYFNSHIIKYDQSASLLWDKPSSSDGGLSDIWYQMCIDHEGKSYIHGHCQGTVYFNGTPVNAFGASLTKIDGDGSVIWQKLFTTPLTQAATPSGVCIDSSNNCFAWGCYTDSLTIEGSLLRTSHPKGYSAYLVKYDKGGMLQWIQTFVAYNNMTAVGGITTDIDGNVSLTGWFYDTLKVGNTILVSHGTYNSDVFVIKYSSDGSLVFAKNFGGTQGAMGRGISADSQNNLYITGAFRGTVNFGTNSLTSLGGYDVFLVKFDREGNSLWAKQAGSSSGSAYERGHAIVTDNSGNSFISGLFWGTSMSFGSLSITSPWVNNLFIAKYSADGTPLWAHALRCQDYTWPAYQMGLDEEGSCYMGGDYMSQLIFDNGPTFTGGANNSFFVKYDASGNFIWNKNIPQSAFSDGYNNYYNLMSLAVYNKNSMLIGGRIINDTLTLGTSKMYSYNSGAFIGLLGDNLPVGISDLSVEERHISVFPNPSNGIVNIKFEDPAMKTFFFSVKDAQGNTIYSGNKTCGESTMISLPHVSPGLYLFTVNQSSRKYSVKLLIY